MRPYGILQPTAFAELPPDTVKTFLIAAATPQASDWESTGSTSVASAGAAGVGIVRFTGMSTAFTSDIRFIVNLQSTIASAPASGTSVSSSGVNIPVNGLRVLQVPGGSTGYSIAALTSGYVMVEQWKK